jgi:release factor glutamine methyltransferase
MPQVKHLIELVHSTLGKLYSRSEVDFILRRLFEEYVSFSPANLITKKEEEVNEPVITLFESALEKLKNGMPLQYVLGYEYFHGLKFHVTKDVLIPRPETEELVEIVIESIRNSGMKEHFQLLDIGTGSGCIAITLKKEVPDTSVFAMDVSEDALQIATQNAVANNAEIKFINADICDCHGLFDNNQLDVIVSNPPYIPLKEKSVLSKQVADYEPASALFVNSEDPLLFYNCILHFAENSLKNNGLIFFEVHQDFAIHVSQLFSESNYKDITLRKDLSGNDRIVSARKQ